MSPQNFFRGCKSEWVTTPWQTWLSHHPHHKHTFTKLVCRLDWIHDLQGLLQNENASLHVPKLLRISRWQQQCIQWNEEPFWAWCPIQLHRSPARESWLQERSFEKITLPLKDIKPFRFYFSVLRSSLRWDSIHTWEQGKGMQKWTISAGDFPVVASTFLVSLPRPGKMCSGMSPLSMHREQGIGRSGAIS